MAESFAGGPLSSQLLAPVRDLAKAFVQDDMTAVDGYFEPGAPLNEMEPLGLGDSLSENMGLPKRCPFI